MQVQLNARFVDEMLAQFECATGEFRFAVFTLNEIDFTLHKNTRSRGGCGGGGGGREDAGKRKL